jgi:predicted methyltransferase
MQKIIAALLVAGGLALAGAAGAASPAIEKALADPARAADQPRDATRHAGELLDFMGVKPGQAVADLIPGGGYFTRAFSLAVGPKGKVYAVFPDEYVKAEGPADLKKLQDQAGKPPFANVTVLTQPAAAFAAPESLDLVFTSQNYHDYPDKFMGPTDPALLNKAVYKALKPGGLFVIVDHAAEAGSGMRDTEKLHRIDEAVVKAQLKAAGFEFVGASDVLRNPADDHKALVFAPAIRGKTDQFTLKFRKPLRAR